VAQFSEPGSGVDDDRFPLGIYLNAGGITSGCTPLQKGELGNIGPHSFNVSRVDVRGELGDCIEDLVFNGR
jgi:hypothetical protein